MGGRSVFTMSQPVPIVIPRNKNKRKTLAANLARRKAKGKPVGPRPPKLVKPSTFFDVDLSLGRGVRRTCQSFSSLADLIDNRPRYSIVHHPHSLI